MKYIASCSFGKDSLATNILAHLHGEPLDEILYVEVMFDEGISAEIPEHREFIFDRAIPKLESWGFRVSIVRGKKTYLDCFNHVCVKGRSLGKKKGFPMVGHCDVNRECKLRPIREFMKSQPRDTVQYIGIAADETKRLERLEDGKISLLAKYGCTEAEAADLCRDYGLLSPIYEFTNRGGCWFCPNARDGQLRHIRKYHPELWRKLLKLEEEPCLAGAKWNTLKNIGLHDKENRFYWEDQQISLF